MEAITFEHLEALSGEVLPERVVLGTLAAAGVHASSVTMSCQAINNGPYSSGGALIGEVFPLVASQLSGGATGGFSQALTCTPATNNVF
jgi:hypothetical protein